MQNAEQQNLFNYKIGDLNPEWLSELTSSISNQNFINEMDNNERVGQRLVHDVIASYEIDISGDDQIDENVFEICELLKSDLNNIIDVCGLMLFGTWLRRTVDPKKLIVFIDIFGEKKLQAAIRAGIEYEPFSNAMVEAERLKEFVRLAGSRVIAGWSWGLPTNAGAQVRLLLPKNFSNSESKKKVIETELAQKILSKIKLEYSR